MFAELTTLRTPGGTAAIVIMPRLSRDRDAGRPCSCVKNVTRGESETHAASRISRRETLAVASAEAIDAGRAGRSRLSSTRKSIIRSVSR